MRTMMKAGAVGMAALLLVACGDKDREPVQFQGQVADGALVGARVFQDLNGDLRWDPDEPQVMTDREGRYVLTGRPGHQAIVVDVLPTTIDLDTGLAVGQAYTLTAPTGASSFISPISTLVAALQRQYPAMSSAEALGFVHGLLQEASPVLAEVPRGELLQNFLATGHAELHGVARILARQLQLAHASIDADRALAQWVGTLQTVDETTSRALWGKSREGETEVLSVAAVQLPAQLPLSVTEPPPLTALQGGFYSMLSASSYIELADACLRLSDARLLQEGHWVDVRERLALHVYTADGVRVAVDRAPDTISQPSAAQVRCQWRIDGHEVRLDNYFSRQDLAGASVPALEPAVTLGAGSERIAGMAYWAVDGVPARVSHMAKVAVPNATLDDFLAGCQQGRQALCAELINPVLVMVGGQAYENAVEADGLSGVVATTPGMGGVIGDLFLPDIGCHWRLGQTSAEYKWLSFDECFSNILILGSLSVGPRVLVHPGTPEAVLMNGAMQPDDVSRFQRRGDGYRYSYLNQVAIDQLVPPSS